MGLACGTGSGIVALAWNPLPNACAVELRSQGHMSILVRRLRFVSLQVPSCTLLVVAVCLAILWRFAVACVALGSLASGRRKSY
jgi:hypothetical protein